MEKVPPSIFAILFFALWGSENNADHLEELAFDFEIRVGTVPICLIVNRDSPDGFIPSPMFWFPRLANDDVLNPDAQLPDFIQLFVRPEDFKIVRFEAGRVIYGNANVYEDEVPIDHNEPIQFFLKGFACAEGWEEYQFRDLTEVRQGRPNAVGPESTVILQSRTLPFQDVQFVRIQ